MRQSFLLAIRLTFAFVLYQISVFVESLILVLVHATMDAIYLIVLHRLHLVLHADLVHVVFHVSTLNQPVSTFTRFWSL